MDLFAVTFNSDPTSKWRERTLVFDAVKSPP